MISYLLLSYNKNKKFSISIKILWILWINEIRSDKIKKYPQNYPQEKKVIHILWITFPQYPQG